MIPKMSESKMPSGSSTPDNGEPESATPTPGAPICEGDTTVITNILPLYSADTIFETLKSEVDFRTMSHRSGEVPRLVAVQGAVDFEGNIPIYRHPSDTSPPLFPFTPTVFLIKRHVEKALGHQVNHCLIQFYRSGKDYISEHSDKTLDIVPGTYIGNVSLGAQRTMVFRGKREREVEDRKSMKVDENESSPNPRAALRAELPHNSLCKVGLKTNMRWLHSIRQDKRMERDKEAEELAFESMRISLTFRLIGTFLNKEQDTIWGQGAVATKKENARSVVNGGEEARRMIEAFGVENRSADFDWEAVYGGGFDVVHTSEQRGM